MVERTIALPKTMSDARDIRFSANGDLLVASARGGVFEMSVDGSAPPSRILAVGSGQNAIWLPYFLGSFGDRLAVGAPLGVVGLRQRDNLLRKIPFAAVTDLDLGESSLVILGADRNDQGDFAPDGTIAWFASVSADSGELSELRPLLTSTSGPGAKYQDYCGLFFLGTSRILADGSILVLPGVEPGVYRYSSEGLLLRTWDTGTLQIDAAPCGLAEKDAMRASSDERFRWSYLTNRRVVDEVLPSKEGPVLVLREGWIQHEKEQTEGATWSFIELDLEGEHHRRCGPQLSSREPFARIRGDVHTTDAGVDLIALLELTWRPRESSDPVPASVHLLRPVGGGR